VTTTPLDIDRLAKVLALLSSDNDGEALAAARALTRLLQASGTSAVSVAEMLLERAIPTLSWQDLFEGLFQHFHQTELERAEQELEWASRTQADHDAINAARDARRYQAEVDPIQRDIDEHRRGIARWNTITNAEMAEEERALLEQEVASMPTLIKAAKWHWQARQEANRHVRLRLEAETRGETIPPNPAQLRQQEHHRQITQLKRQRTQLDNALIKAQDQRRALYRQSPEHASLRSLRERLHQLRKLVEKAERGEDVTLPESMLPAPPPPRTTLKRGN
jgi:hypothetical protein